MGLAISVQRIVNMDPQVVIIAGSIDHLQSRSLLNGLIDGFSPSSELIGEVIMTLLSAIMEAEKSKQRSFKRQMVQVVFILSIGYALLPEPLHFVHAMVI